nr:plasmid mobilization relaxosome protein MobC [uncultured Butyrivibrio sp.]
MQKNNYTRQIKRTKVYDMRFTENEWDKLQNLAKDFEMPISEYIRWSLFQRRVTMRILIDDESSPLSKIRFQLDKIGTNINQITKVLNSGFVNPSMFREELKTMFLEIHNAIDLLNRVQSESNSKWRNAVSRYSRLYQFDKTAEVNNHGDT